MGTVQRTEVDGTEVCSGRGFQRREAVLVFCVAHEGRLFFYGMQGNRRAKAIQPGGPGRKVFY